MHLALACGDTQQRNPVAIGQELKIVADMYRRHEKTQFLGEFFSNALDAAK